MIVELLVSIVGFALAAYFAFRWYDAMFVVDDPEVFSHVSGVRRPIRPENFLAISCPAGAVLFAGTGVLSFLKGFSSINVDDIIHALPRPIAGILMIVFLLSMILMAFGALWPFRLPAAINPVVRARRRAELSGEQAGRRTGETPPASPHHGKVAALVGPARRDLPSPFSDLSLWLAIITVLYGARHLYVGRVSLGTAATLSAIHLIAIGIITIIFIIGAGKQEASLPKPHEISDPLDRESFPRADDILRGRAATFSVALLLYFLGLIIACIAPLTGYNIIEAIVGGLTSGG